MALATNATPFPFLWDDTNATSGLVTSAVTVMTTELSAIASAAVKVSSVGGSSGFFLNTFFAQAIWADIFYFTGNPAFAGTLAAGANLAFWFLTSLDGGTTFEQSTIALPRPPDFIIPLNPATNLAVSLTFAARNVLLPALGFKLLVQNNSGLTLPTGATTNQNVKIAPVAMQY